MNYWKYLSFLGVGLLLFACSSQPKIYDDPIAVMLDTQQNYAPRKHAADQAKQQDATSSKRIKALNDLLYRPHYPHWQRKYAIDELVELDEQHFRTSLNRRIILINNWETLQYIFDLAIARQWKNINTLLVRSYARPARGLRDSDRLEKKYIQKLNPNQSLEQVVFDEFTQIDRKQSSTLRASAWMLLCRLMPQEKLIEKLKKTTDHAVMIVDLKIAATQLATIPKTRSGLIWLTYLRNPSRKENWNRLVQKVAKLTASQRQGLAIRHLQLLNYFEPNVLAMSQAQLRRRVGKLLHTQKHHLRGPTYDGPMRDYPQEFRQVANKLSWADLATIDLLLKLVHQPAIKAVLFKGADHDLIDTATEYGGILNKTSLGFKAKLYPPFMRRNDYRFYASKKMITALYTGIAHLHFHANQYKNRDHAGPGIGDLKFAAQNQFNCLVFTFIDRNHMNVDFYQADGLVVDLTTITR